MKYSWRYRAETQPVVMQNETLIGALWWLIKSQRASNIHANNKQLAQVLVLLEQQLWDI